MFFVINCKEVHVPPHSKRCICASYAAHQLQTLAGLEGWGETEPSLETFLVGYEIFCLSHEGRQGISSLREEGTSLPLAPLRLELISQLHCAPTRLRFVFSPFQAPGFLPLGHSAGVLGSEGLQ